MEHRSPTASKLRALGALVLCTGFLAACSGTGNPTQMGLVPQSGLASQNRAPAVFVTPTPAPTPALAILAGVNLNLTALPLPVFALSDAAACFGGSGSGGDDEDHGNQDHHGRHHDRDRQDRDRGHGGHGHHGSGDDDGGSGSGVPFGTPYSPSSNVTVSFGAFSLTDPCSLVPIVTGGEPGARQPDNIVPVPPPGGAYIVASDSTAPGTLINVDGPATTAGSTYAFAQLRFGGFTFRAGHTYAFALAAPATPTPSPSPTPTPHGHGDDD